MKRIFFIITVPILIVAGLVAWGLGYFNQFPGDPLAAISSDSQAVLYSIDPREGRPTASPGVEAFHDWPILGQTVLSGAKERQMVIANLRRAARGAWDSASCFNPRHAIRATNATGTYDVLLCFECGRAAIFLPNGETRWIPIHGSPEVLNQILTAARVPLRP